jgi:hypothetical protein
LVEHSSILSSYGDHLESRVEIAARRRIREISSKEAYPSSDR